MIFEYCFLYSDFLDPKICQTSADSAEPSQNLVAELILAAEIRRFSGFSFLLFFGNFADLRTDFAPIFAPISSSAARHFFIVRGGREGRQPPPGFPGGVEPHSKNVRPKFCQISANFWFFGSVFQPLSFPGLYMLTSELLPTLLGASVH